MKLYVEASEDSFESKLYDIVEHTVEQFISETDQNADYDIDTSINGFDDEKYFNIYVSTSLSERENEYLQDQLNNAISQYVDVGFGGMFGFSLTDAGLDISIEI